MVKLLWPLLIINERIPGLIWRRTAHFVQLVRQLPSYMATLNELLFGAKLEAWRHKMFHIFHFFQCKMVLGIPFSEYLMQSLMRKVAWFQFLSCQLTLTWGQWIFSHLMNPDWPIQISHAPAVCKVITSTYNFQAFETPVWNGKQNSSTGSVIT